MVTGTNDKSPYEVRYNRKPDLSHIRVFGCVAYIRDPGDKMTKFQPRAYPVIFVGYDESDSYIFWDPTTKKELRRRDAWFHEDRPGGSLLTKGYLENLSSMTTEKHAPDPKSRGEAMSRDDWPMWKKAEDEEYQNLDEHDSWEIVEKPSPGVKPIKTVFKYKTK